MEDFELPAILYCSVLATGPDVPRNQASLPYSCAGTSHVSMLCHAGNYNKGVSKLQVSATISASHVLLLISSPRSLLALDGTA